MVSSRGAAGELFLLQENGLDSPEGQVAENSRSRSSTADYYNFGFHRKKLSVISVQLSAKEKLNGEPQPKLEDIGKNPSSFGSLLTAECYFIISATLSQI
jgi:hypothetical protein